MLRQLGEQRRQQILEAPTELVARDGRLFTLRRLPPSPAMLGT
jgi:DNA-binding transcriptional regulator YbjK